MSKITIGREQVHGRVVYYDTTTQNKSFLKVSDTLRKQGIKHSKFPLTIYDKDLIGVDPWDPEINTSKPKNRIWTMTMQAKIINEVINNYWYFIREVVKVITPGGNIPFELHRGNLAEAFCILHNINQILVLPRQHYKTQSAAITYLWQILYVAKNYKYVFGHKSGDGSKENLKRVKDALEGIPPYLKAGVDQGKDIFNQESMLIRSTNNQIVTIGAAGSEAAADKQGRGFTVACCWIDEFAFVKYNKIMFGSLTPANTKAAELARANGTPYGILLTTTPNNIDVPEGAECKSMMEKAWKFDERIYDWYYDHDEEYLHNFIEAPENSENNFVFIEFTYKQLGETEAWLEKQKRALQGDMALVKREILLQWTLGSNTSPFSEEQLDRLSQDIIKDPYGRIDLVDDKYCMTLLRSIHNMHDKNYILGIDVAGGLGRDASAITVIDPANLEPVAVFKNNQISITELAKLVEELTNLYFPSAVVIPERNNSGITLIELLEKTPVDKKLYSRIRTNAGIEKITQERPNVMSADQYVKGKKTTITRVKGVDTTVKARDIMINEILFNIVNNQPELINNDSILDEIKTLERKKNGKIEHRAGKHDDQLFSYLIGLYPLLYDTNIGKFVKVIGDGVGTDASTYGMEEDKTTKRQMTSVLKMNKDVTAGVSPVLNIRANQTVDDEEKEFQDKLKKESPADSMRKYRKFFSNL